jgi:tetratricopeptide (TPR) repeat protein
MPAINVLIVAFDDIDGKAVVPSSAMPLGAATGTSQGLSSTAPGLAQAAAAALRRALVGSGWSDVLTTAPDSAVMRRAFNEGRITPASLDLLRNSLSQLAALSLQDAAAPSSPMTSEASPLTPVPAADGARTAVMQSLTQAASRLGQVLGYRALLALAVIPQNAATTGVRREATYVMYLVDTLREVGSPLTFDEGGADAVQMHETAALAASAFANKELRLWTAVGESERAQKIQNYLQQARAALEANKTEEARAAAQQALALDSTLVEAHMLLGDANKKSDPVAAAAAYRLALGKNAAGDGEVWARIAAAQAAGRNWPGALEAARRALELRHDSAALRQAMALAQFGRAQLFPRSGPYG